MHNPPHHDRYTPKEIEIYTAMPRNDVAKVFSDSNDSRANVFFDSYLRATEMNLAFNVGDAGLGAGLFGGCFFVDGVDGGDVDVDVDVNGGNYFCRGGVEEPREGLLLEVGGMGSSLCFLDLDSRCRSEEGESSPTGVLQAKRSREDLTDTDLFLAGLVSAPCSLPPLTSAPNRGEEEKTAEQQKYQHEQLPEKLRIREQHNLAAPLPRHQHGEELVEQRRRKQEEKTQRLRRSFRESANARRQRLHELAEQRRQQQEEKTRRLRRSFREAARDRRQRLQELAEQRERHGGETIEQRMGTCTSKTSDSEHIQQRYDDDAVARTDAMSGGSDSSGFPTDQFERPSVCVPGPSVETAIEGAMTDSLGGPLDDGANSSEEGCRDRERMQMDHADEEWDYCDVSVLGTSWDDHEGM
ncbi:hypothetical protein MMC28_001425 [Mycoblastus sanguinarius]|nr:hypothetical protein [Mycoblastus sanguinarius]